MVDALDRVRVIDGVEKAEAVEGPIVKRAADEKLVVFATEVGLRALSYDISRGTANQVDLLLVGSEGFSSESNLQAFARVDRGTNRGARRIVLSDRKVLENRVRAAKKVDEALADKFGRRDGLELRDAAGNIVEVRKLSEEQITGKDKDGNASQDGMSLRELLVVAGEFGSKENKAESAIFFINEQTSSKLLKEPMQRMIANETTAKAKRSFENYMKKF